MCKKWKIQGKWKPVGGSQYGLVKCQNETGNFRGQICFQVQQTHGQLHTQFAAAVNRKKGTEHKWL